MQLQAHEGSVDRRDLVAGENVVDLRVREREVRMGDDDRRSVGVEVAPVSSGTAQARDSIVLFFHPPKP